MEKMARFCMAARLARSEGGSTALMAAKSEFHAVGAVPKREAALGTPSA